jgi:YqaJ-like viral recombinase domain
MAFENLQGKILAHYASHAEGKTRGYIGASMLGHACERRIWLEWNGAKIPPQDPEKLGSRQEKFDRGRHEEERLIKALQGAGYLVLDRQGAFSVLNGNFQGHIDGIILDEDGKKYVLEIKSANERNFTALQKKGIEAAFPGYYLQCQMYMHFLKIPQCLFLVVNKNNGEIYKAVFSENEAVISKGMAKLNKIISHGQDMPARLPADAAGVPTIVPCQYCEFFNFCWTQKRKAND